MSLILLSLLAQAAPGVPARVDRLLSRTPVIDGHNDLPWEVRKRHEARVEALDLTRRTADLAWPLQTDVPRLRRGRVGGQFWSVWIPADTKGPRAVEMTLEQIDIVRRMIAANSTTFALARTADDVRRIQRGGRIASLIGIEGGHQIDGRLSVLREMREAGVAYMTLTHTKSLSWADASTDTARAGGLDAFGRQVVREMNRIGMIVDVSHTADTTVAAVLAESNAPVIASHSAARALDDAPRNLPDDLLRRIGAAGGVVMVNFYPAFISQAWRDWDRARTAEAARIGVPADAYADKAPLPLAAWDRTHPMPRVTARDVADHIDHIARIAGRGAVGIGGDFDGIGGTQPDDMDGVAGYPLVFAELARRGWGDADLSALAQGNILRVMTRVEAVARAAAGRAPEDAIARD